MRENVCVSCVFRMYMYITCMFRMYMTLCAVSVPCMGEIWGWKAHSHIIVDDHRRSCSTVALHTRILVSSKRTEQVFLRNASTPRASRQSGCGGKLSLSGMV